MQMDNIPKGWNVKSIGDCFRFLRTKSFSRAETESSGDVKYVHYGDIHTKYPLIISPEEIDLFVATEQAVNADILCSGDLILLDASEDYEGTTKCVELSNLSPDDKIISGLHTIALRDDNGVFANKFKAYITSMPYVKKNFWKQISGVKVYGISKDNLKKIKVLVPPVEEQRKIAEILGTWNRAIEELSGLIAEKRELKRGLMQRLLTGAQRLPGFIKPWKKIKLSDVLEECTETTTTNNQYDILTSSRRGIFKQEDYFDKQVASQDNIGYKIIHNGDFTYRAMTDDDKFCFNQLTDLEIGIVSPAYAVFRTKKIPGNILKFILNSERFGYELLKEAQGGTRKSLKYNSLIKLQIYVPDDEKELDKLSDCLFVADSEIDLLNQKLDVLREQKRGLMQKLLTGEIRVKTGDK